MKIKNITQSENIYTVTFRPNLIYRLFKQKEIIKKYKDIECIYKYFDGNVYINENGKILGPMNWITIELDNWRRRF